MNPGKEMCSKVEIHIACKNLIDKDVLSKSDPFVVMFSRSGNSWIEHDRTETAKNNLNPVFTKGFSIDYYFEQYQLLKFEVYDSDSTKRTLAEHEFLGRLEVSLGSVVGEHSGNLIKNLIAKNDSPMKSTITINAEELSGNNHNLLQIAFRGKKLDKKDFFGKSDPYLVFYRQGLENTTQKGAIAHKTEIIKNNLNPLWKEFTIPLTTLCNGDKDRSIMIECYDWDDDSSDDLIGFAKTTVNNLLTKRDGMMELINPKKKKKKNSGILELVNIKEIEVPTFLEYIMGGMELCFHVAVDYTASNGDPRHPDSLHYMNPQQPNEYMQALISVGKICEDYDSDKLIPAYGFGAEINGQVYHNFNMNYTNNPICGGVNGVIAAYQSSIQRVKLYGPTNFSPIIRAVSAEVAQPSQGKYHILLIITDGVISDMDSTMNAIVDASRLPMSIIIVGVGGADFSAMDRLDADDGLLRYGGKISERDIVQFVPFRRFSGQGGDALAKEVLKELPDQLVKYMTSRNIKPQPKPAYQPPGPAPPSGQYAPKGPPPGQYAPQGPPPGHQYTPQDH